jgi:hypothetical protein
MLSQPLPRVKPEPKVERRIEPDLGVPRAVDEPVRRAEVLRLDPWKKNQEPWRVVPSDRITSYVAMEPTAVEKEIMRAVGDAARARRARALSDPLNLYGGGEETIEDVVKRQDDTR